MGALKLAVGDADVLGGLELAKSDVDPGALGVVPPAWADESGWLALPVEDRLACPLPDEPSTICLAMTEATLGE